MLFLRLCFDFFISWAMPAQVILSAFKLFSKCLLNVIFSVLHAMKPPFSMFTIFGLPVDDISMSPYDMVLSSPTLPEISTINNTSCMLHSLCISANGCCAV